jgi:hypothetical protein
MAGGVAVSRSLERLARIPTEAADVFYSAADHPLVLSPLPGRGRFGLMGAEAYVLEVRR